MKQQAVRRSGSDPNGRGGATPRARAWLLVVLAAVAGLGGGAWYWGWGRKAPPAAVGSSAPARPSALVPAEPPPIDPAEVLGLSAELPQSVEALKAEAMAACARLVSDLPDRPEAHAVLALAHVRFRKTAEAVKCWHESLRLNPRFSPAYLGLGSVSADKGDLDQAEELLRKALAINPGLEGAYGRLAEVLLQQGKGEEALAIAHRHVDYFPQSRESHYWLGQCQIQLGDYGEAKRAYEEAIRIDPQLTPAYYSLAIACARLGQHDKAREYQKKLAVLKQTDRQQERGRNREYDDLAAQQNAAATLHFSAGDVHLHFGNLKKAEAHLLRAAALAPKLVACREALVTLYECQGRPAAALGVLRELLVLEPHRAARWRQAAALHARLGQCDAAEVAWRKAIALAPDDPEARLGLIDLHLRTGHVVPDAVDLAETAARMRPSARACLLLSAVRDEAGDRAGALEAIQQALEFEPDNPQLQQVHEQLRQR